jgi:uncharacterized protein
MAWELDSIFNKLSQLDVGTAGGLFLYGLSFIMFFVPVAILFFESRLRAAARKYETAISSTVITHLQVYPIKSCRGIPLQSAKLLRTGLDLDRKWMFVDKDLKFITIREHAKMTLVNTSITEDDELEVKVEHNGKTLGFKVPAHPTDKWLRKNTEKVDAQIWSITTDAWMYSESLTLELNEFFEQPVRFVMKGPTPRILGSNGAPEKLGRKESTMFPDMMPVLVANEKSLAELNVRLNDIGKKSITWEHYRPNIIVAGNEDWEEDKWKTLRIVTQKDQYEEQSVTLDVTQRCARCQVSVIF